MPSRRASSRAKNRCLPVPDFHRLERTSLSWRTLSCLPRAPLLIVITSQSMFSSYTGVYRANLPTRTGHQTRQGALSAGGSGQCRGPSSPPQQSRITHSDSYLFASQPANSAGTVLGTTAKRVVTCELRAPIVWFRLSARPYTFWLPWLTLPNCRTAYRHVPA